MIEVARFFFTGLDVSIFCATKVQISKTLEPPGVDGDRLCGGVVQMVQNHRGGIQ